MRLQSTSIPEMLWVPAINDIIRIRECVVCVAVEGKVNLPNTFLHGSDKRRKITEPVFIPLAAFYACHRQNSVVENEPDVGGISRCWTGQDLPD